MRTKNEQIIKQKKHILIEAALMIIEEEGEQALSLRYLARKTNQSVGNIYYYFKNKEELLSAVAFSGYEEIMLLLAKGKEIKNRKERMKIMFSSYLKLMYQKGDRFLLLMRSKNSYCMQYTSIFIDKKENAALQRLQEEIEGGIKEGIFRCKDVKKRAMILWSSMYGLLVRMMEEGLDETMVDSLINEMVEMMMDSLEGR